MCGRPVECKTIFLAATNQVQSCVRPICAASMLLALMKSADGEPINFARSKRWGHPGFTPSPA